MSANKKKKKGIFSSLFNFEMPESRKKLTKKFKEESKKKYDAAKKGNITIAKKETDKKITENRKKYLGFP